MCSRWTIVSLRLVLALAFVAWAIELGWAGQGTPAQLHWAFRPVRRPALPHVDNQRWVQTPLDAFVLAKLEAAGLTPSPQADKRTLIRRASYDLTGLPPKADEVEAFLRDKSADAFGRVVDRLLDSPRFGERWGRYWLDIARYADTKGYVFEEERRYPYAYTYRDYVIRAFNDDLPYDQFLVQQIAADLLPLGEDKRPLAALGFLTLGRRFLNSQPDIIDDRIDVVSRGTMALTVACARCHDHKFDPIPSRDYYSLYGVFASTDEPTEPPILAAAPDPKAQREYLAEHEKRENELNRFRTEKEAEALRELRRRSGDYLLAAFDTAHLPDASKAEALARQRKLDPGVVQRWARALETWRHDKQSIFGPWFAFAELPAQDFGPKARELCVHFPAAPAGSVHDQPALAHGGRPTNTLSALVAQEILPATAGPGHSEPPSAAGGTAKTVVVVETNALVLDAFQAAPPSSMNEVAERYGKLFADADEAWESRTNASPRSPTASANALPDPAQESLRQILYAEGAPANLPLGEVNRLFDVPTAQKVRALRRSLEELDATHPGAPPRAMVLHDRASAVNPHVFIRGNPNNPGPEVPRQFLAVLAGPNRKPFGQGSGRLELARSIASRSNPLTARVMVNRIWLHLFGRGLVGTPSDFGLRSDPPTHPELLDYLAWRFMEDGWSVKRLIRLVLMSATYQQSSDEDALAQQADPTDRWLWRMNRRRLDFEALRDSLLEVAGQLDAAMGGHSVDLTTSPYTHRRTVYGFVERQNLPGLFRTFDFANPDATCPQRFATTVPQQALYLMNNPFVREQARHLVDRAEFWTRDSSEHRIQALYQAVLQRPATAEEVSLAERFVGAGSSVSNARALADPGLTKPGTLATSLSLGRWEEYAQVLLLSNELAFVD